MRATDTILWAGGWGSACAVIRIVLPPGHSEKLIEMSVEKLSVKLLFVCEGHYLDSQSINR